MKTLLALLFSLVFASGAAFAADFAELDADGSGGISAEEAAADQKTNDGFAAADADANGELSPDEFATIQ